MPQKNKNKKYSFQFFFFFNVEKIEKYYRSVKYYFICPIKYFYDISCKIL